MTAPYFNVYGKLAAMFNHSFAETILKRNELFRDFPFCAQCAGGIPEVRHATALHRQRDDKWLLVHDGQCAMNAVMAENRRLDSHLLEGMP